MVFVEHIFSFWESGIMLVLFWSAPIKTSGIESTDLWAEILHTECFISVAGGRLSSVWPIMKKRASNVCTWIPPEAACAFFPQNLVMYPYSFTIINLSHECNHMLSPMNPSSKSPKAGVVLMTPTRNDFQEKAKLY